LIVIAADLEKANTTFHEQQPDGRRGERYTTIETGAVAQSMSLMAEARGLTAVPIGGTGDQALAEVLALPADLSPLGLFLLGCRPA
tara:strand:- start:3835 stop:4092 length:258 start_codon:yes stop_codon:yes gene_type:complete